MNIRIRLRHDIPVAKAHGLTKGRVMGAKPHEKGGWAVVGDLGEVVKVNKREAERLEQ